MTLTLSVPDVQRRLLVIVAVLSPVVFVAGGLDDTFMPKAFVVLLGVGAALLLAAFAWRPAAPAALFRDRLHVAAASFAGAVLLTTLTSDARVLSFAGTFARYTGALMYLVYLGVLLLAVRRFAHPRDSLRLAGGIAAGAILVGAYAVMQEVGLDPIPWDATFVERVTSTMGNPNFLSGYLGAVAPLCVALILARRPLAMTVGTVALGLSLAGIVVSRSEQGLIALAAGSVIVALVYVRAHWTGTREATATWSLAGLSGVGAVLVGLGVFGAGPLSRMASGLGQRVGFWQTALAMFVEHPVLGVGFDRYGAYYRQYKVVDPIIAGDAGISAIASNPATTVDNPHNLVLAMLTGGGLITGAAFVALFGLVLWRFVRWLREPSAEDWLPGAMFGSVFVAYLVVSMVSIDVPPIAFLGWLAAGVLLAHVSSATPAARRGRNANDEPVLRPARSAAALALVAVLGGALWYYPLQANLAAGESLRFTQAEAPGRAVSHAITAVQRAPWRSQYWFELGRALTASGDLENAANAFYRALEEDPRDFPAALTLGRVLREGGHAQAAIRWFERALELDPKSADVMVEVAQQYLAIGLDQRAQELARQALAIDGDNQQALQMLAIFGGTTDAEG